MIDARFECRKAQRKKILKCGLGEHVVHNVYILYKKNVYTPSTIINLHILRPQQHPRQSLQADWTGPQVKKRWNYYFFEFFLNYL